MKTITARNLRAGDWIVHDGALWQITAVYQGSSWGRNIIAFEYTIPGNPTARRWWFSASDEVELDDETAADLVREDDLEDARRAQFDESR